VCRRWGTDWLLAGDEGGAARSATLLGIKIREHRTFPGDAVDIGRLVSHDAMVVTAGIEPTNVVDHDEKNVGFVRLIGYSRCSPWCWFLIVRIPSLQNNCRFLGFISCTNPSTTPNLRLQIELSTCGGCREFLRRKLSGVADESFNEMKN
jgi:hypothetical protein